MRISPSRLGLLCLLFSLFTLSPIFAEDRLPSPVPFSDLDTIAHWIEQSVETKAYTFRFTPTSDSQNMPENIDTLLNRQAKTFHISTYSVYDQTITLYVEKVNFYVDSSADLLATIKKMDTLSDAQILISTSLTPSQVSAAFKQAHFSKTYQYAIDNGRTHLYIRNNPTLKTPIKKTYALKKLDDLEQYLKLGINAYADQLTLEIPNSKLAKNQAALERLRATYLNDNRFSSISTLYTDKKIDITLTYRLGSGLLTQKAYDLANQKADKILKQIIKPDMDSFEKVKAVHDYLIQTTVYDKEAAILNTHPETITPVGPLLYGRGICSGYASTFDLFMKKLGIESIYVSGEAKSSSGSELHAWNKVKLDGLYYNIDTTWDDPVSPDGENLLLYDYYLVSDETLRSDHSWLQSKDKIAYTDYDYYLNHLPMIDTPAQLAALLKSGNPVEFCSKTYTNDWFKDPLLTDDLFKVSGHFTYATRQRQLGDYQVIRLEINFK